MHSAAMHLKAPDSAPQEAKGMSPERRNSCCPVSAACAACNVSHARRASHRFALGVPTVCWSRLPSELQRRQKPRSAWRQRRRGNWLACALSVRGRASTARVWAYVQCSLRQAPARTQKQNSLLRMEMAADLQQCGATLRLSTWAENMRLSTWRENVLTRHVVSKFETRA